jgi:hypothetical protein
MSGESCGEAFETPTAPKDNAQVNITEAFCNGLLHQTNIEKGYDKYAMFCYPEPTMERIYVILAVSPRLIGRI